MGLLLQKKTDHLTLGIWKIEEGELFFCQNLDLSPADAEKVANYHPKRRLEWLAGRWLIRHLLGKQTICKTDSFGKPFLANSPLQVSISHSDGLVAVIASVQPVGIDIQAITPKIARIAPKFMTQPESATLEKTTFLEHLHVYWGAKEALYKAYGRKELNFKQHILVQPFAYKTVGSTIGQVVKGDFFANYDLFFHRLDTHVLVYCLNV